MSKSPGKTMSNLSQALITAALGLMVGYESAAAQQQPDSQTQTAPIEQQQAMQALAEAIHAVIQQAHELERVFMSLAKKYTRDGVEPYIGPEEYSMFQELVTSLRGIELALKNVVVPAPFSDLHAQLRRSVAKGRSWVSVVNDLARQAYEAPRSIDGQTSGDALRALADHSTKRLIVLANA